MKKYLNELIYKLIDNYDTEFKKAHKEGNFKNPFRNILLKDIPNMLSKEIDERKYYLDASIGVGRWAKVPWIAIFNKEITDTAKKGVYIVYLLNKDTKELFLTLNQGTDEVEVENEIDKIGKILKEKNYNTDKLQKLDLLKLRAQIVRDEIANYNQESIEEIRTGKLEYDAGCIFYKKYSIESLPNDEILYKDLHDFINLYEVYYNIFELNNSAKRVDLYNKKMNKYSYAEECSESEEKYSESIILSNKEIVETIKKYISSKGFYYEDGLIENFYLSLKSKPFVILAGISGTGKTRLIKLFAEALGANTYNGRYKLVSVRPDWSDSSDLFGHVDLNGNFIPGAITEFLENAESDKSNPYFLCLDEMNLARVEYYLSDILSIMETRDYKGNEIITDSIHMEKHKDFIIPENLYIIGTVNMDETTFPFSKKVLDRANTIEFSHVDLIPKLETIPEKINILKNIDNRFLKSEYLYLLDCMNNEKDEVIDICNKLQNINSILEKASAHIGYRVRDEIIFYMLNNKNSNMIEENRALDNEILQKILPRIQGSSSSIRDMICELFKYCAGDYDGYRNDSGEISKKMFKALENKSQDIDYPKSAKKLAYMMRRYEEDGFTSYWL